MAQTVEFHPDARDELVAARDWYAERGESVAVRFTSEVERAIDKISENPIRWPLFLSDTRRYVLRRFPVVYRESTGNIEVLALAHNRRRPGYWQHR